MREKLGHLDVERIAQFNVGELEAILRALPKKPRYPRRAAETILDCARQVAERWNGDASKIWDTTDVRDITSRLVGIRGVGNGIAHMVVNILINDGKLQLPESELRRIDVKPDVHVQRVFYRTGLAEAQDAQSAIRGARIAYPNYPGALDQPAWQIGRKYCHPRSPLCGTCPLEEFCIKRGIHASPKMGKGALAPKESRPAVSLSTERFIEELLKLFQEASASGNSFLEITARELHRRVGGYPSGKHRMPSCCEAMKRLLQREDVILSQPPKGKGAGLRIRYKLPREQT